MHDIELDPTVPRAIRFLDYVDAIGEGELVSRSDMAAHFEVAYGTALYHLERAVSEGYLNKVYGFATKAQPGWLYARKDTMPRLEGF